MVDGCGAMVGRDAELAAVTELVDGARDRRGGTLLVAGEAGVGKTRLLAEAARHADGAGLLVLTGRAVEGGGAYRPLAEALVGHLRAADARAAEALGGPELRPYRAALGRLLPEWTGEPPAESVDPVLVLGEGLVRLLAALNGGRGCLLVLEDLHWADADTLAVLEYLAGAVLRAPVLIAGSVREEDGPPGGTHRLAARPGVRTVRLERLGRAAVVALAERCAGAALPGPLRDLVVGRSDGLPLLVEELVAGGLAERAVPPTLAGLVAARLAALGGAGHRRVLDAAAVLGGDPDWALLQAVTGLPERTVLGALRAAQPRLVVPAGDALRWRHALTRDAVLAAISPPERAALARACGAALLRRGGPDTDPRAADLLAAGGDRDGAAAVYLRLARDRLDRGAPRDAAALLERAEATAASRYAVAVERVRLLTVVGEPAAALEAGARVLDAATADDHAGLCLRLAEAAIALRRWDDADRFLRRAGRPGDPDALVLAADAAFGPGDLARAARLAGTAIVAARDAGRPEARCRALVVLGRCAMRHDLDAARAHYEDAAQLAAEHGLRPCRIMALLALGTVDMCRGTSSTLLDEARDLALETGRLADVIVADLLAAEGVLLADGPRAVEPAVRDVAARAGRLGLPNLQAVAELLAAFGRAADGDAGGMRAVLDAAAGRPHAPIEVVSQAPVAAGLLRLMDGDLPAAGALFDEGMGLLEDHPQAAPVPLWGLWALLRTVLGDRDGDVRARVRGSYAALRAANRGVLHYADAVAAGRAGRPGRAAELMAAGDALLAGYGWWRRLGRLLALRAAVDDGWGDPVPGLRAALAAFTAGGEPRLARTCRDLLRRAGAPTRAGRGRAAVPAALRAAGVTSREMDVLALVTDGLTNRQIAQRLFLSPRTVDTHVGNLLAKTGAADRTELRARHRAADAARPG
ncbi:ATP-binding protein [Actinomadura fibrosa]|uniref:ATP-binding protein n=2 Tax=Actinomadura fibrosa TaxID=111802 RepID=A0ABW2XI69_9ACTN